MPDFTNIKHAYIGQTNIKSIYEGSVLRWQEPSSEPVTVFRAIRTTEDDTWSVGDGVMILLRNPQDGKFYMLQPVNSTISTIKYINYYTAGGDWHVYYDYNTIGSDGKRLCYFYVGGYTDPNYAPYTVADTSNGGKFAKLQCNGYTSSERYLKHSTTLGRNILSWGSSGTYYGCEATEGYRESDLPDLQSIDSPWIQNIVQFSYPNQYSISPTKYTYSTANYVAWVKTLETGVYMFKKVTANI